MARHVTRLRRPVCAQRHVFAPSSSREGEHAMGAEGSLCGRAHIVQTAVLHTLQYQTSGQGPFTAAGSSHAKSVRAL
ncbi:hypothetical protein WJX77_001767 [Trebouxia sp. C0004]